MHPLKHMSECQFPLFLLFKTACLKMCIPNNMHTMYNYEILNYLNYLKQWFSTLLPHVRHTPFVGISSPLPTFSSFLRLTASKCTFRTICIECIPINSSITLITSNSLFQPFCPTYQHPENRFYPLHCLHFGRPLHTLEVVQHSD